MLATPVQFDPKGWYMLSTLVKVSQILLDDLEADFPKRPDKQYLGRADMNTLVSL